MSARREAESPVTTAKCWTVCVVVSWFAMQAVDLAFQVLS
jgi:hypothetical protein